MRRVRGRQTYSFWRETGRNLTLAMAWALIFVAALVGARALGNALWPQMGSDVRTAGELQVDASNASDGYVLAHGAAGSARLKLRVTKGEYSLMYDLGENGEFEPFPLQLGSGEYLFELFRNVEGNKYAQDGTLNVAVELKDENAAFLLPNPYVPYTEESEAVKLSDEICAGLETDQEKLEAVRQYILANFRYDNAKAASVTSGTMPSIEYVLENKMGICQDLSALAACMLRVQGIPTKMVIGYIDRYYHSWNSVLLDGEFQLVDFTAELGAIPSGMTYTVERFY